MKRRNRWLTALLLLALGGAVLWFGLYGSSAHLQVGAFTAELAGDGGGHSQAQQAPDPATPPAVLAPVEEPPAKAAMNGALAYQRHEAPMMAAPSSPATAAARAPASPVRDLTDYLVKLQAEQPLRRPGTPGELRVAISAPAHSPDSPTGWAEDSRHIRTAGKSAEVEPYAPDFEIRGERKICMALDPGGSIARFTIVPLKTGPLKVGATVRLYSRPECRGTPTIKQPENLEVMVVVDWMAWLKQRGLELWQILWQKLLEFWGLALGLISGLVLFLLRRRIKRLFGYQAKD